MATGELIGTIAAAALGAVVFGSLAVGVLLVARDTIRQRGKWGINLKPAACTQCGVPAPLIRTPTSWHEALWGGWTCAECGFELDKWGRPVEKQNTAAKWAVLRAAEEAEECEPRPRTSDERVREADDKTQPGNAR